MQFVFIMINNIIMLVSAVPVPFTSYREATVLAKVHNAILPSPWIVKGIHEQADCKIAFRARKQLDDFPKAFKYYEKMRNTTCAPDAGLISGPFKTIVRSSNPNKAALYGGWYSNGQLVQPYNEVHSRDYFDYSHSTRLVLPIGFNVNTGKFINLNDDIQE